MVDTSDFLAPNLAVGFFAGIFFLMGFDFAMVFLGEVFSIVGFDFVPDLVAGAVFARNDNLFFSGTGFDFGLDVLYLTRSARRGMIDR